MIDGEAVTFMANYSKAEGQKKEEKGQLCKCMHELSSQSDIYSKIKRPELVGVIFEVVVNTGVINISVLNLLNH